MTAMTCPPKASPDSVDVFDGEEELVLSTVITHRFLRSGSTVHHFVLAGEARTTLVLLLGGRPDSWWTWHGRIEALAARHFVISPALLDHSLRASHVVSILDDLGAERLHVVADEGGVALADAIAEAPGMRERMVSYACLGTGPLAHLQDPELTNRAIIQWIELREQTMGVGRGERERAASNDGGGFADRRRRGGTNESRRARAHVLEGA